MHFKGIKMLLRILFFLTIILNSGYSFSSVTEAEKIFSQYRGDISHYWKIAKELVDSHFYYAATPFMKEYLFFGSKNQQKLESAEDILDDLITKEGIKQFEFMSMEA